MKINGKVHCFFEQSGTFKNEFIKLGIPAEDYDIQNNFGQTDHVTDLFKVIEYAYDGKPSLFDNISKDDLVMAFFPCIYFCEKSQCAMTLSYVNYKRLSQKEKINKIIERSQNRQYFYELILKLFAIAYDREIRLIVENPYSPLHYLILTENFITKPTVIDKDRTRRGDYYKKPTSYWFVNCLPTNGFTSQQTPKIKQKTIAKSKRGIKAGICSEDRSMISSDYARNFICDFILGGVQTVVPQQVDMFDELENDH